MAREGGEGVYPPHPTHLLGKIIQGRINNLLIQLQYLITYAIVHGFAISIVQNYARQFKHFVTFT